MYLLYRFVRNENILATHPVVRADWELCLLRPRLCAIGIINVDEDAVLSTAFYVLSAAFTAKPDRAFVRRVVIEHLTLVDLCFRKTWKCGKSCERK